MYTPDREEMRSTVARWITARSLPGLIAASALELLAPQAVHADCGTSAAGYHYAYQSAVRTGYGGLYNPPNCLAGQYFGWVGIDGLITYPSHFPNLNGDSLHNHSNGFVSIGFGDGGWVQEGWFAGCVNFGADCRQTDLGRYTEIYNPGVYPTFYEFKNWDTAPYSATSIFRIEYGSAGCWKLYFDYSTLKKTYCQLLGSGRPYTGSEVKTIDGGSVEMAETTYGYLSPNTNSALRIKGANGWVSWNTTLSTGETGYYDERYGQPGCNMPGNPQCLYYNIAYFNLYYKFKAYGA